MVDMLRDIELESANVGRLGPLGYGDRRRMMNESTQIVYTIV